MKKKDLTFHGYINPLLFFPVDLPQGTEQGVLPSCESFLEFLSTPGMPYDPQSLVDRYKEVADCGVQLHVAPIETRLMERLVWPLRHAKASHMMGNYQGTISLCGMVAEMVAILLFDLSEAKIGGQPMTRKQEEAIFGSTFEKLGQKRRVDVLSAHGLLDDKMRKSLDLIRTIRRKYLHLWSQEHDALPRDSAAVYEAALRVVVAIIGQDFKDGMIKLNPALVKYLLEAEGRSPSDDGD